jgi:N6-L-threonylcarbamoyladenine synthase
MLVAPQTPPLATSMIILGIDTSCDDTSVAVLDGARVLSNIVSSQVDLHALFGGVVPEIASRKHVEMIDGIYRQALTEAGLSLAEVDVLAVTQGPGLIGSLLAGLCFGKGLALSTGKPLVGVNHVEAHAMSIFLEEQVEFPFISLIVSGGHTVLLLFSGPCRFSMLGSTRDDAAGEAFDKVAKYLGLGYPGGRVVEELARAGRADSIPLPRPMIDENNYDFSFSGLKTAFINYVRKWGINKHNCTDILASFQEAACEVLTAKTVKAAKGRGVKRVVVGGGVASNNRLREMLARACAGEDISVSFPSPRFCTDNGAMVAATARFYADKGLFSALDMRAFSRMRWSRDQC